jgi:formamidopyrimidine-DNA glycosylase
MSGQILVRTPNYPQEKCERIKIIVSKGKSNLEVRFVDQRMFGGMLVDELVDQGSKGRVPGSAQHIALDPLDENFDIEDVTLKISKRSAGIKSLLLNQKILSGIGNIYADETLWLTKTHYLTPGHSLTRKRIQQVIETAKDVLLKAVAQGGTSFDEQYKNVNGESGYFYNSLIAYGQTGLPCPRCGTPIKREAWSNRGSHICPRCQKPQR